VLIFIILTQIYSFTKTVNLEHFVGLGTPFELVQLEQPGQLEEQQQLEQHDFALRWLEKLIISFKLQLSGF